MLHPVLTHKYALFSMIPFWAIHAIIPAALFHYYGGLNWMPAAIDGMIYSFVMLVVGFFIWFPIAYGKKNCTSARSVFHNFVIGIVAVLLWIMASSLLCHIVLGSNEEYMALNHKIIPIRILWGVEEFMMIMVMYHFFVFYRDLEEKRLQEQVLKKQVKEAELKTLKAQINPHFLFNSLNSVSALTITHPENARKMINQLSELLRFSLRNKHTELISLSDEFNNIRRYMDIEKVRFGDLLLYNEVMPENCAQLKLPAMILQPIYENAIKHGLYESLEPITVTTNCISHNKELEIVISNNFDPTATSPRGAGLGLKNTANILRNLYNREGLIKTSVENQIFTVKIIIPQN